MRCVIPSVRAVANGLLTRHSSTPVIFKLIHYQQTGHEAPATLLPDEEVGELRHRWDAIQTGFVDEPRRAVESADALVAAAMKRLAEVFASERAQLEGQWDRGDDVSTEDLRLALQRYRAFFGRLLAI